MSTKILGKAGKKLFERHLDRYAPADPLYEFYTDNHGKKCRRKVFALTVHLGLYQMRLRIIRPSANYHRVFPRATPRF
jgi:hypothetical protein